MATGPFSATTVCFAGASTAAPKGIGFLQRVEGVRNGLEELHSRLTAFHGQVTGSGEALNDQVPRFRMARVMAAA